MNWSLNDKVYLSKKHKTIANIILTVKRQQKLFFNCQEKKDEMLISQFLFQKILHQKMKKISENMEFDLDIYYYQYKRMNETSSVSILESFLLNY